MSEVTQVTQSEDQLQAKFWEYCWNNYPQARKCMWAVPNSAIGELLTKKDAIRISTLKATGLLSGVWDLHMFWHGKFHIIESKVGNNQLTVDRIINGKKVYGQKEWGELMASHGATRHIYRTLEEGIAIFESIIGV